MIRPILRNEWRNLLADRTLLAAAVLLTLVVGYAARNGAAWVAEKQALEESLAAEYEDRLVDLRGQLAAIAAGGEPASRFRDPRNPAHAGSRFAAPYAVLPQAPLAAFAVGQSDLLPAYYKVTLDSRHNLFASEEIENPTNLLAGRFDLAFVIVYLFPLVILALSYNLLSGDKEQGLLAMTLAQPLTLQRLVSGKIFVRGAFVIGLTALLCAAAAVLAGSPAETGGVLPRLLLWFAVTALYGLFWFAAAAAVNSLNLGSAANAVALAAIWLGLAVVVPAGVNLTASALHPVPSRVEMIQAMREAGQQAAAKGSQILAGYYEDHPELAPEGEVNLDDFTAIRYAVDEEVERMVEPVAERYERQLNAQQAIVGRLRFLSPAILAQEALEDLAGSGFARFRHFAGEVERFAARWKEHSLRMLFQRVEFTPAHILGLPRFEYEEERAGALFGRVTINALGILVPALLLGLLARRGLARYPVAG